MNRGTCVVGVQNCLKSDPVISERSCRAYGINKIILQTCMYNRMTRSPIPGNLPCVTWSFFVDRFMPFVGPLIFDKDQEHVRMFGQFFVHGYKHSD